MLLVDARDGQDERGLGLGLPRDQVSATYDALVGGLVEAE